MFDVAIIGGGISGLATAHYLVRRGRHVVVLERQVRPGGNAQSERMGDGFLMEHGPSTVNAQASQAVALSGALGLDGERCDLGAGVKQRYLVDDGGLHRISVHPMGFLLADYLSLGGRLRLLAEPFVAVRADGVEETIEQFSARRFGAEFARRVMDPLVGGIFAGQAAHLSVSAVFPQLLALEREHGSVLRGVIKRRRQGGRQGGRMPSSRLFSWRGGIASLPGSLAAGLGSAVRTGMVVRAIRQAREGFRVDMERAGALSAKAVVLATQPHMAARLLDGLDREGAGAAGEIQAPPLAVAFLGYDRKQVDHPLDGLGFLTPLGQGIHMSGAQFCSTMFPGRAPDGCVSMAAYFGAARAPEAASLPARDLADLAHAEFSRLLGIKGAPLIVRVRHWPLGLPQYRLGHQARVDCLNGLADRRPGLFATGNYFAGPSVGACLAQAETRAAEIELFLAQGEGSGGMEESSANVA